MDRIRFGETIENEAIEMDDTVLVGCSLVNCVLIFRGGEPKIVSTSWQNAKYVFLEEAGNMIRILSALGWRPPKEAVTSVLNTGSGLPN